jgi:uncharacterized metal-binding protein
MAQYQTHVQFNIFFVLPFLIWVCVRYITFNYGYTYAFTSAFIYGTLFMNPDLDLADKIKLFSIKGFLTLPFRGYSLIFKHRGISHAPVWGTLTRILWLGILVTLILFLFDKTFLAKKDFLVFFHTYGDYLLFALGGFLFADLSHVVLDLVSSK